MAEKEICYNLYMGRYRLLFALLFVFFTPLVLAETVVDTEETPVEVTRTVTKSSLAATRVDSKLNEAVLHKSVVDYSLPEDLLPVMKKCVQGEEDDCYFSLKTFENSSDPATASAANLELAYLSLQRGLMKQALAYVGHAAELSPDDPFIQLSKGWFLLSAGKYKKAREAFADLMYLTADFEYVSSAKLGTALSFYYTGDKEKAIQELQYLYTSNPYAISFVSYMLGKIAAQTKDGKKIAPVFLQQSLSHDEKNYAAAKLYAEISAKEKEDLRSWQYYATLYALDPDNKKLAAKMERYATKFEDKRIDYLFYFKLDQPIVQELVHTPSERIKMALYANREQVPQSLISASVMGAGRFVVTDEKLGEVLRVASYTEKKIVFNAETGGVDLQDAKGRVEFSAKRPFTISSEKTERTLLVSKPLATNIFAADLSDKELAGALIVIPNKEGFTLVNMVSVEDLIPSLLAVQAPNVKETEALKALAIVLRSSLQAARTEHADQPYQITDNDPEFKFKGINLISTALLDASKSSTDFRLTQAQAGFYSDCGVVTANGLANSASLPGYVFSPVNVSKYILSNPPADLYSRPQDPTQWASIKWIYEYDAKEIEQRLSYKKNIGKLRAIVPVKFSPQGRILSMRFEGSKGSYQSQSAQETVFILSAGTMRSNLFDVVPFYKGKNIKTILVRGYDTGEGNGLCLHGADGLAKQGADYMAIIKYYFPEARILNTQTGTVN